MAMPSVTVMVPESRAVAPPAATPSLTGPRLAHQRDIARRRFVPAGGNADESWWICSRVSPIA